MNSPDDIAADRRRREEEALLAVKQFNQSAYTLIMSYTQNTQVRPHDHGMRFLIHPGMWNLILRSDAPQAGYAEQSYIDAPVRKYMGLTVLLSPTIGEQDVMLVMGPRHPALTVHAKEGP